jgi:RNA polymerase-binding transcription factor DksA
MKNPPIGEPGVAGVRGPAFDPKWAWHHRTLLALQERLQRERSAKLREATDPIESHGVHPADSATDEFDHDLGLTILAREENSLREVQDAIARIHGGTYGICEATKHPIPASRLRALPWCRYTIEVEAQLEAARSISPPRVPRVVSLRGPAADIPYSGSLVREGMETEPVEHEEPNAGKATVEPARPEDEEKN